MENQPITQPTFDRAIALLRQAFPRDKEKLESKAILAIWLNYFAANLTAVEFGEAVNHVILHYEFLPAPDKFVKFVKGSIETKAFDEFNNITFAATKGSLSVIALSDRAKEALVDIGGFDKIRMADQKTTEFLQKQFTGRYLERKSSTVVPEVIAPSLPPAQTPAYKPEIPSNTPRPQPKFLKPVEAKQKPAEQTPYKGVTVTEEEKRKILDNFYAEMEKKGIK